jgi:chromosome segregation ATPase
MSETYQVKNNIIETSLKRTVENVQVKFEQVNSLDAQIIQLSEADTEARKELQKVHAQVIVSINDNRKIVEQRCARAEGRLKDLEDGQGIQRHKIHNLQRENENFRDLMDKHWDSITKLLDSIEDHKVSKLDLVKYEEHKL